MTSIYGEQHPDAEVLNLRGVPYLHLDQAGAATTVSRDFKGNVVRAGRRLTSGTQYRQTMDWRGVSPPCRPARAWCSTRTHSRRNSQLCSNPTLTRS